MSGTGKFQIEDPMLGKCANPACLASFRKLGSGKLFAFESVTTPKSAEIRPNARVSQTGQSPVFFWLCEICSLTFTLGPDEAGQLMLQRIPDGVSVTIFDHRLLDQAG
jgi:hypothetical protein